MSPPVSLPILPLYVRKLLRQGDSTVEDFYAEISAVWCQIDSIGPPLSPSTCDSCKAHKVALETRRTHDLLTHFHDEFEQLRAQLVSCEPCVSLMKALATVRNKELCLYNAGLLQSASSSSILAAHSSSFAALTPPHVAPLSAAPSSEGGGGGHLHCDYCGKKTHVEAYCYKKKKAQSRRGGSGRPSQGIGVAGGSDTGGSQRSSAGSETQEMLMLLHHLAASTPPDSGLCIVRCCCCFSIFFFKYFFMDSRFWCFFPYDS
jgi:hypothetical protein